VDQVERDQSMTAEAHRAAAISRQLRTRNQLPPNLVSIAADR
jgi:hypothetical protein